MHVQTGVPAEHGYEGKNVSLSWVHHFDNYLGCVVSLRRRGKHISGCRVTGSIVTAVSVSGLEATGFVAQAWSSASVYSASRVPERGMKGQRSRHVVQESCKTRITYKSIQ